MSIDPNDPALIENPFPTFNELRETGSGVLPDVLVPGTWSVTRYDDVLSIQRDRQKTSNQNFRANSVPVLAEDPLFSEVVGQCLLFADPPSHTRLRSLLAKAFTRRTLEQIRPEIEKSVLGLLENVERDVECNFVDVLAGPLPTFVIADLLGVPKEDSDRIRVWSDHLAGLIEVGESPDALREHLRHCQELAEYLRQILSERRRDPRADVVTILAQANDHGEQFTEDELLGSLIILLVAGNESTSTLLGNAIRHLSAHPDVAALLRENPDAASGVVEELLRYYPPFTFTYKTAKESIDIGGATIEPGTGILLLLAAANRDPRRFDDPDTFDPVRADANRHLSFSSGIHSCIGAPLARMEAEVALKVITERFGDIRAGQSPVVRKPYLISRGYHDIPTVFA